MKATLILIPLLGLQFILFPMRPSQGPTVEEVYLTIVALVTSFQVTIRHWFHFTSGNYALVSLRFIRELTFHCEVAQYEYE